MSKYIFLGVIGVFLTGAGVVAYYSIQDPDEKELEKSKRVLKGIRGDTNDDANNADADADAINAKRVANRAIIIHNKYGEDSDDDDSLIGGKKKTKRSNKKTKNCKKSNK